MMKRFLPLILIALLLIPQQSKAQDEGVASLAGGLLSLGAGIAAVEQMKEQAELTATQWVLSNHPVMNSFSLKTLSFDGKKLKDISSTSVITYKIQQFTPKDNPELDGKKDVFIGFTSPGWSSEYGINPLQKMTRVAIMEVWFPIWEILT